MSDGAIVIAAPIGSNGKLIKQDVNPVPLFLLLAEIYMEFLNIVIDQLLGFVKGTPEVITKGEMRTPMCR